MMIHDQAQKRTRYFEIMVAATTIFLALSFAIAKVEAQQQSTRSVFNSTCASCHGQHGVSTPVGKSLNAPDLGSTTVRGLSDAQLKQIISEGKGNMPPFKNSLSEAQISSLIKYIRTFSKPQKQSNS
jgi:mono/diheme cytochrome c family protein